MEYYYSQDNPILQEYFCPNCGGYFYKIKGTYGEIIKCPFTGCRSYRVRLNGEIKTGYAKSTPINNTGLLMNYAEIEKTKTVV